MSKRIKKRKSAIQNQDRKTNWVVLGGILGVGIIALFGLLFFTLQNSGASTSASASGHTLALQEHCANNPDNCVVNGSEDAPVTVVEVSDYGCSHCKNFNLTKASTLKEQFVDAGIVRWITVPYALGSQDGYPTAPSANAALCSAEQNAFDEFHHALFEIQGTDSFNTLAGFLEIANNLNLDSDALSACVEDGRYNNAVQQNIQVATEAGVNSTPSFFVNGEPVRGDIPLEDFQQIIETAAAGS